MRKKHRVLLRWKAAGRDDKARKQTQGQWNKQTSRSRHGYLWIEREASQPATVREEAVSVAGGGERLLASRSSDKCCPCQTLPGNQWKGNSQGRVEWVEGINKLLGFFWIIASIFLWKSLLSFPGKATLWNVSSWSWALVWPTTEHRSAMDPVSRLVSRISVISLCMDKPSFCFNSIRRFDFINLLGT